MAFISDNVRQNLVSLVPSSLINEITCFVFYDHHPRDKQNIEITICTSHGEIKEFYQREPVHSAKISNTSKPVDIRILRNATCELFYLVALEDEVIILARKEKLQIYHRISNVDSYEVEDSACRGQGFLKIIRKDDAVPLIFDENLENLGERAEMLNLMSQEKPPPIMINLGSKLIEAKYNVVKNEKFLKDITSMRQSAAHTNYNCFGPNVCGGVVFQEHIVDSSNVLTIKTKMPWIKICNRKVVLIFEVSNKSQFILDEVYILLHSPIPSTIYSTKLYTHISEAPYWKEKKSNSMNCGQTTAIVVVMNYKELKNDIESRIDLNGLITYKINGEDMVLPFNNVNLSCMDVMGEDFDVLSTIEVQEDKYSMLALLASTEKTEISMRHIKNDDETSLNLLDVFCEHLHMERIPRTEIIVHRKSPYHVLHGVMIKLENMIGNNSKWTISIHARSSSQLLAFIHYMHDAVPHRLIATTLNQIIVSKSPALSEYEEETTTISKEINCIDFGTSMLKQSSTVLGYLDDCMMKMNESKNPTVQNKIGSEIDIFAGDVASYKEFRNKILQEASRGIKSLETLTEDYLISQGNTLMDIE